MPTNGISGVRVAFDRQVTVCLVRVEDRKVEGDESKSRVKELMGTIEAVGYGASLERLQPHGEIKPATNAPADPWQFLEELWCG